MEINKYVSLLKEGEIVAFPTETVYGLGADAWNPSAIKRVFEQKGRPADNPLIVHITSVEMAESFAKTIPADARKLMAQFWPGPLTLIVPKKPEVLDLLTAGLDTVALRWPRHPLAQELISEAGPLVAPSANSSGKPSPTKPEHVRDDFGEDFPVLEAGKTDIGLESTVLDVSQKPHRIYRPGAVSAEQIEEVTGKKVITEKTDSESGSAKSPGTKYTHYAPDAAVKWLEELTPEKNILYLLHSRDTEESGNIIHYRGDFRRMARELFDRFRQADHEGYTAVAVEPFADHQQDELIPALKNRIDKALSG